VKALYGNGFRRGDISLQDVSFRVNAVISRETEVIRAQLKRNGIAIYEGRALFLDPHTVEVEGEGERTRLKFEKILIACGTRPAHSSEIPFDDHRIVDTDHLSDLGGLAKEIHRRWCRSRGLGVRIVHRPPWVLKFILIDERPVILDFVDREIVETLLYHLRQLVSPSDWERK